MTQLEHNLTPEQMQQAFRDMQIRMRNYALHQFDAIGSRTVVMLQNLDLFDDSAESTSPEVDLDVLREISHPRRVNLPPGPLILYATDDESKSKHVELLPMLLLSESLEVRMAAFANLEQMVADGLLETTPKTSAVIAASRDALVSDVPRKWRPAAVSVSDAFSDDIFISLAGVRQSLECVPVIQDSLNLFVPKVMLPEISPLDSISFEIGNPETEHAKLTEIVQAVVSDATSLSEACEKYYSRLGYLPLAPSYSMGEVADLWLEKVSETDAWAEVWAWADTAVGPVPKYHACSVFVLHPEWVPEGRLANLWERILEVVHESGRKGAETARRTGYGGNHDPSPRLRRKRRSVSLQRGTTARAPPNFDRRRAASPQCVLLVFFLPARAGKPKLLWVRMAE